MPSPEYDAWNANSPPAGGVNANAVASATPAASSGNGSDVAYDVAELGWAPPA